MKTFTGTDSQGNKVKFKQDEDGGKQFRAYEPKANGVVVVKETNYPPPETDTSKSEKN
ncbi:MAG: hypothetical protein L0Y72_22685 [Gemmataceae bacterium]|nr:hypothetical protein [Gemmataceae bacterium]MCI0741851.1 hypothetical protein [Gemmataceae bacterium]